MTEKQAVKLYKSRSTFHDTDPHGHADYYILRLSPIEGIEVSWWLRFDSWSGWAWTEFIHTTPRHFTLRTDERTPAELTPLLAGATP